MRRSPQHILTRMDEDGVNPYDINYPHEITRLVTRCAYILLANHGSIAFYMMQFSVVSMYLKIKM